MPTQEECQILAVQAAVTEEKLKTLAKNHEEFLAEFKEFKEEIRRGVRAEVNKTISIEMSKEVKLILLALLLYLLLGKDSVPLLQKFFNL